MAGVSTKGIKSRIRSMESTKQITKAMEMVAASKLRRAQARVLNSRPYFEIFQNTIADISLSSQDFSSVYFQVPTSGTAMYIVIAGDRGLAGGYNSNVLKLVVEQMDGRQAEVLPIGKKALDYFQSHGAAVFTGNYAEAAAVTVGDCFSIAKQLCTAFRDGKYSKICVAYTNFESMLSQSPAVMKLLPLEKPDAQSIGKNGDILYEPGSEEVFDAIIPEYLGGVLYGALCEARASEQASRRTAMENATQNAEDMIDDLSLKYNRARQAAITQEITEIVAGA